MKMEKKIKWMLITLRSQAASPGGGSVLPAEQRHPCDICQDGTGRDSGAGEGAGTGAHAGSPSTQGSRGPVQRGLLPWQLRSCSRSHPLKTLGL